jgi:hypothetical protein
MRTIRVDIHYRPDATTTVVVSTEVIVEQDGIDELETAGSDAREAIDAFVRGYGGEQ